MQESVGLYSENVFDYLCHDIPMSQAMTHYSSVEIGWCEYVHKIGTSFCF